MALVLGQVKVSCDSLLPQLAAAKKALPCQTMELSSRR